MKMAPFQVPLQIDNVLDQGIGAGAAEAEGF